MHKKNICILLVLIGVVFANSLFNGFVGDDEVLIVKNQFYKSPSNFSKLFSQEFITSQSDVFNQENLDSSGAVAYRPVIAATLFLDQWVWQLNPFGYHLTNLLIHLFAVLVLYLLIYEILRNKNLALICSLIYGVHPIQTESVAAIAYRHGILATLFVICSLLLYI